MWKNLDRHSGARYECFLLDWIKELNPQVHALLSKGGRVCDVGCGRGRALRILAKVIFFT